MISRGKSGFTFPIGGGETGALARSVDWAKTALGPPQDWPDSLKATLGILFHSRHPMFLWWGPELIQFYNDAYVPSFGKGKHPAAMGQPGRACWPEIWPIIWPQIRAVMEHGTPSWNEDQLVPIFRNGHIEDAYWTYGYSPVLLQDGTVGGTLVVCTETTQRVVALREAEVARARLSNLFRIAPAFVCALRGPQHVFEMVNERYQRLIGVKRPVLGRPVKEALPEVVSQGFIELLDGVYQRAEPFVGNETFVRFDRLGDGQLHDAWVSFVYQPRLDHSGRTEGIDVFGFEVTEHVKAREALESTQAELRERVEFERHLVGIVSHDLRNPLAAMLMAAATLLRREGTDARATTTLTRLIGSGERADRMIRDLLDFSQARLGTGMPMHPRPVDLHELVAQVVEEARIAHPEKTVLLELEGDGRGEWDGDRLAQVATNLLVNAIDYSSPGTAVRVVTRGLRDEVVLEVCNDSEPIPQEMLHSIFEPMLRGTTAESPRRSIGLGLYIVDQVVRAHGGTVEARSSLHEGTTFSAHLPRRAV